MPDHLIDPADPVERQNEKLRRIVNALMDRVERNTNQTGNAFGLFQRAIALEGEVKARTRDLQRTLDELNHANRKLEAASAVAAEANRAKSRFVAAASHDVRQPLNAAKLFLGSLAGTDLDAAQRGILDQLGSALDSVENLIGSLLEISRLDSSSIRAEISALPAWHVLGPLADEFAPMAEERGIELRVVPSSHWIESDPYYLRQIVQNVLSNAIQYTGEGGSVLLGCRRRDGMLEIQVSDTGPGIAEADIPLIFEEFKRLRAPRRHMGDDGVGLGLAIVRRACNLLHHPYRIESELGRGTSFTVAVPVAGPAGAEDAAGDSAETLVVLLVSPDPGVTEEIATLLDHWGAGAVFAATLDEATTIIEQLGMYPDAVLLDAAAATEADMPRIHDFLALAPGGAILTPEQGTTSAGWPETLPRLTRPVQPHRLRAALYRGRAPGA